jgi:hypothetical protein
MWYTIAVCGPPPPHRFSAHFAAHFADARLTPPFAFSTVNRGKARAGAMFPPPFAFLANGGRRQEGAVREREYPRTPPGGALR